MGGVPLGEIQPSDEMKNSLRMFEAVSSKAPTMDDSSKLRPIMPKTPCQTAPYYPQKVQSNFETLLVFKTLTRLKVNISYFTGNTILVYSLKLCFSLSISWRLVLAPFECEL
jgi:hypothetical protein